MELHCVLLDCDPEIIPTNKHELANLSSMEAHMCIVLILIQSISNNIGVLVVGMGDLHLTQLINKQA